MCYFVFTTAILIGMYAIYMYICVYMYAYNKGLEDGIECIDVNQTSTTRVGTYFRKR